MKPSPVKGVLFDLDGTLLDTAGDLALALNHVLHLQGLNPLPLDQIKPEAGRGCKGLLKLGLNIDNDHCDYPQLAQALLNHYEAHICDTTQLFPGMADVLTHLEQANIPWGIVTNKPSRFTTLLLEKLHLTHRPFCIISGDTLKHAKPHPEPLLHACELLQLEPQDCLYIGDSEVDMIACQAAGMPALIALYGYISAKDQPTRWHALGQITQASDIIAWLN